MPICLRRDKIVLKGMQWNVSFSGSAPILVSRLRTLTLSAAMLPFSAI